MQEAPLHEDGSVAVIFHVDSASNVQALESYLRTNGGDPRNVGEDYIEAYVPVALLVPASEQPGVIRVESIVPPQPSLGPTTSQGVAVHGANNWHDHGYTGVGVKVGVIDVGFGGIVRPQSGGELPGTIMARCYRSVGLYDDRLSTCEASDEVHGTPVAESLMGAALFGRRQKQFLGRRQAKVLEGTRPRRGVVRRGGGGRVVSGRRGCLCRQRALGRSADGERQASRGAPCTCAGRPDQCRQAPSD